MTARQLNRATLERQLLLRRQRLGVAEGMRRVVAVQAQAPASPYVAFHNRLSGFAAADLDAAFGRAEIIKATLLRITLHAVHADDYPAFRTAMVPTMRSARLNDRRFTDTGHTEADADPLVPKLLKFASEHLVRRYLEGFGPATVNDVAQFILFPRSRARSRDLLESMGDTLQRLVGPDGTELFDVPGGRIPANDSTAPPRLMAMWDSVLLAYSDRSRIIPPEHRQIVIRRNGDVLPTLLVDGYVAGVWRAVEDGIEATAFRKLSHEAWAGWPTRRGDSGPSWPIANRGSMGGTTTGGRRSRGRRPTASRLNGLLRSNALRRVDLTPCRGSQ